MRDGTFYSGRCGEAIVAGSWLAESDLASHTNDWVDPVEFSFRGHTLLELPPNGQGSIAGWALEALGDDLSAAAQVEALAAAYARGYASIGGTSYVCAADGDGMGVSLIQSIYYGFGSQVIAAGCGFMLQNRGSGFVVDARPPQPVRCRETTVSHDHARCRARRRIAAGARCWVSPAASTSRRVTSR